MTDKTVKQISEMTNKSVDEIIKHLVDAGLNSREEDDIVTIIEQEKLVAFLRENQGKQTTPRIKLRNKTTSTASVTSTTGAKKNVEVVIRKKLVFGESQRSKEVITKYFDIDETLAENHQHTFLRSIFIENFRGIKNLKIDFAERLTVISGKNGTAKSTILGLIAQVFNFEKDYVNNENLNYRTLNNKQFKSLFSEHFRLSREHDFPGEMSIYYCIYDAYLQKYLSNLQLVMTNTSGRNHRTVVRNNIPTRFSSNTSRNVTHPVIYLSLKRLYPIAERRPKKDNLDSYFDENTIKEFIKTSNLIVGKPNLKQISSTTSSLINSSVVHGENYDYESVSTGEDNIGQIVSALFSFKKLKETYTNYHGGILLIDELEAGLFPFAQKQVLKVLDNFSKNYQIQIIFTSHSPEIIEDIFKKSLKSVGQYKNNFLTQAYGSLQVNSDYSWQDIYHDLNMSTVEIDENINFPKVNVYFEDNEAYMLFQRLITINKIKEVINPLGDLSISCKTYSHLTDKSVPEFCEKSILVLDGDIKESYPKMARRSNVVALPSVHPPDRLLFKFLYYLDPSDDFWKNSIRFTKEKFLILSAVGAIVEHLNLNGEDIEEFDEKVSQDLKDNDRKGLREKTKNLFKNKDIKNLFKKVETNPFDHFLKANPDLHNEFKKNFIDSLVYVLKNGYGVQEAILKDYFDNL